MNVCKDCYGVGGHQKWCAGPPEMVASQQPETLANPIRVFQCKGDCCLVQVPSKRFWFVEVAGVRTTLTRFGDAIGLAARDAELLRRTLPTLEPTA